MKKLLTIACLSLSACSFSQTFSRQQYKDDFEYFWATVRDNYSYWDKKQTDWEKVKNIYQPIADTISTKESFIALLEKMFYEIYDHHASLTTNTVISQRLVPSGTDIWAEYVNGKPIILEVRPGFGAAKAGLRKDMELTAFDDVPIEKALQFFLPKCLNKPDLEAKNCALRVLLAGNHSQKRKITVSYHNKEINFFPDETYNFLEAKSDKPEIESKVLTENIGYILINNSLGDDHLIQLFDSVLINLKNTKALILDLRNTPSGGNTTVARAILGRFITREGFYQKHELTSEEKESGIKRSWVEIVSPRKPVYKNLVVVLVDHWTGSVSEGIAVGFDALKRGKLIGTKMAGLNGANYSFNMPNTGIRFSFPSEKLFHVRGTPREFFTPPILIDAKNKKVGEDYILSAALKYLKQ